MTNNQLKIIACISMLADHAGFLLFPELTFLRYIGRLALPIFAFCIAEGARHTRSKSKYLFSMLALALLCQAFYLGEDLLDGKISEIYLNILFTFTLSLLICFSYLYIEKALAEGEIKKAILGVLYFSTAVAFAFLMAVLLDKLIPLPFSIDYGFLGTLLPLFALLSRDRRRNAVIFSIALVAWCIITSPETPYVWFALFTVPLFFLYNGKRGKHKLKTVFYLFYPLHFALLYGIDLII